MACMDPAIEIKDVHRSFRKHFWHQPKKVLDGVSLSINKGEVFGFLGPNGAGKTTTIKIITGLIRPTRGSVRIFGQDVDTLEVKKRIGFLPEAPYFYDYLTGYEFLRFHQQLSRYGIDRKYIFDLLTLMDLKDAVDVPLRHYSRGMLQRIGFAQVLINDPDLLILDEPLSGLDPIGRKEIKDQIMIEKKKGKTIFFSSHILPDAEEICDRIGIIMNGRILQVGALDDLLQSDVKTDEISLEQWFYEQVKVRHDKD